MQAEAIGFLGKQIALIPSLVAWGLVAWLDSWKSIVKGIICEKLTI